MAEQSMPPRKRARILFLAWGYSIHARRRIQLFADDPAFEVAVVSNYDYGFTGAENILLTEALKGRRCQVEPAVQGKERPEETVRGHRGSSEKMLLIFKRAVVHCLPQPMVNWLLEIRKNILDILILRRAVKRFDPDVVFLQTLLYPCYLAFFLPRSLPMMVTFWNGDILWWAKWSGIERVLKKWIVVWGARRANAITVNSRLAREVCLSYGPPPDRIHQIHYPGVDLTRFKPEDRTAVRRDLGIPAERVVLAPRGIGGYLNSDILIEGAAEILKTYPDTLFLFVSGAYQKDVLFEHQRRVRQLGIEANFRWEGQVAWEQMHKYYQSADVVVSLSSNDSLPNCMLEAMACGIPLVMGDIPQISDWVKDGVNGFLVPVRDPEAFGRKVVKVFSSTDAAKSSMVGINLELVKEHFHADKQSSAIKDLIGKVAR